MFDNEKQSLINKIKEKSICLEEIKRETQEIEDRKELIREYESALSSVKFCKKILKLVLSGSMIISLGMIAGREISLLKAIILALIASSFCIISFAIEPIKESFQAKKAIKEKQSQYEEAKQNEEKDKELKLSLTDEYTTIENELVPLNEMLSWIEKTEELQKLGYIIEKTSLSTAEMSTQNIEEIGYDEEYKPKEDNICILGLKL